MEQCLSTHCNRVMIVGVPSIGNARSFLGICVQDGGTFPKIDVQASMSISYPCFKLTDSRMKRGGIDKIAISCIFLASSV